MHGKNRLDSVQVREFAVSDLFVTDLTLVKKFSSSGTRVSSSSKSCGCWLIRLFFS